MAEQIIEFVSTSGCKVRIHRPDISDAERTRRMQELKNATAVFMKAVLKQQSAQNIYRGEKSGT